MELVLAIATILGGITAIWFLLEKYDYTHRRLLGLIKIRSRPSTSSLRLKLLRKVNTFLDNGDISSAKVVLMEGNDFINLHINRMIEIIIIEQKYGQIGLALPHVLIAKKKIGDKSITPELVQLKLLEFKIKNQAGDFDYVEAEGDKLITMLELANEKQKIPSVANRVGVFYSVNNNTERAKHYYNKARRISEEYNLKHTEITTRMFMTMSQCLCRIELNISNPYKEITKIQNDYIREGFSEHNLDLWQTHLMKTIVQTLFCESAILYIQGYINSAYLRLCAANLLVVPAKASKKAEGYADLLNLVQDSKLKELLIMAMSSDDENRERFLASIGVSSAFLVQLQNVVKPNYSLLKNSVWSEFREYVDEHDKNDKK